MNEHEVNRRAAVPPYTTVSLVLFVGAGLRPDPAMRDTLARAGMCTFWLPELEHALHAASAATLDAVVLDGAALGGDVAHAIARLRSNHRCPLVVITDRAGEAHEIAALELGADTCLSRPLSPRRLHAQLAALTRLRSRSQTAAPARAASLSRLAGWTLDRVGKRLCSPDRTVELTELQITLLQCLIEQAGRIVSRATLAAALPKGSELDARSVDVYIHRLRRRLHACSVRDVQIETIRGRGFKLNTQLRHAGPVRPVHHSGGGWSQPRPGPPPARPGTNRA